MHQLFNGILRDFCTFGVVLTDVEFGSDEFWKYVKAVDVKKRMRKVGQKFPTTLHVIASDIKKLQVTSDVNNPL